MPKRKRVDENVCSGKRSVRDEKTGEIIPGVRITKSGKYEVRTSDPIKRKLVYLGTFHSLQQASETYQAKRAQIEAAMAERNRGKPVKKKRIRYAETLKDVVDEKTGERIPGIRPTWKSGKYGARLFDPIKKKRIYLGTFDTIEQACKAHQAKKAEYKAACESEPNSDPEDAIEQACKSYQAKRAEYKAAVASGKDESEPSFDPEDVVGGIQDKVTNDDNVQPKESPLPDSILKILEEFGATTEKQGLFAETKSEKRIMEKEEVARIMQERSISVTDEKYGGGGAMGFHVPSNNAFVPVIDNYGNLLGRFSQIDDLSLIDW